MRDVVRIAMWSGPRNISTALMRSWGSRDDTTVADEPFYAYYLRVRGAGHPGRREVLAAHETDWRAVAEWLTGPVPGDEPIFYQKHMAHHLLPEMEGSWLERLRHAFLIREPREMLTSLAAVLPEPDLAATGLPQQWRLFDRVRERTGRTPPVVDARDVLEDPRGMLEALCDALDVPFRDEMLSWEPGPRPTDGAWAHHWYDAVYASTGFRPYVPKPDPVPVHLDEVYRSCLTYYEQLYDYRLTS